MKQNDRIESNLKIWQKHEKCAWGYYKENENYLVPFCGKKSNLLFDRTLCYHCSDFAKWPDDFVKEKGK